MPPQSICILWAALSQRFIAKIAGRISEPQLFWLVVRSRDLDTFSFHDT